WPYVCQDRMVVEATSLSQIENGWIPATTLYDFHFDRETGALNTSGRRQLRWILTHVPEEQQRLDVVPPFDARLAEAREMSVQNELAQLNVGRSLPIERRIASPLTRNAIVVETIDRAAVENSPAPVINYQGISSAGQ